MIDSGNPPNGQRNPWRKLEARLGTGRVRNYFSIYDTLDIEKRKSYTQGQLTHWKIDVKGDRFTVEVGGKKQSGEKVIVIKRADTSAVYFTCKAAFSLITW